MSYGFKIIGSDAGGTFTVSDTELDILNLIVTDAGRAHSFTLPGGLLESDMIFVKNPSAPGGGDWSSVDIEVPSDYLMTVTFDTPYLHKMNVSGETVTFTGTGIEAYTPQQDGQFEGWKLAVYNDWQTEFDYFVVRKASTIMADPSRYDTSMNYGLRVVASNGEVSFDSRALGTNYNFDIVSYLPPLLSNNVGTESSSYVMTKDADEYVNIEWSATDSSGSGMFNSNWATSNFFGLRIGSTIASAYDAIVADQNDNQRLQSYPTGSLIGATLRLGGSGATVPPDDGGDVDTDSDGIGNPNATGSLSYQSGSAITEGSSITFNANTSEEGAYHVRVFQTSGSGNDLGSDRVSFFGDTKSATFTTTSPTSSRSVSYTNVANYIGTYSRNSVASYSRTVAGSFSRDFAGNYVGEYTGEYSGAYARTRTSTYDRTRVEGYARSFSATYSRTRTSAYVGTYSRTDTTNYSREFLGIYTGNFTRNSTLTEIQEYSRNLPNGEVAYYFRMPSTVTYSRTRYSTYNRSRQSTRTSSYARSYGASYIGNYSRDYTRSRVSAYTRDRTVTYSGYYAREFTRNSVLSGTESYSRQVEIEPGEFEEIFFTRTPDATNYSRTRYSAFSRTRGVTRNEYYSSTYTATFTGDFIGNYGRTRVTNFVGDYARTTSASYTGNYAGDYTRVGSYARNYLGNYVNPAVEFTRTSTRTRYSAYSRTRTKVSSYARDFTGNYFPADSTRTLYYIGNYSRGFTRNFTRTVGYEGTYTGNYVGDFAAAGRISTFTGNYSRGYTRTIGDGYFYTANNTFFSVDTNTSYDEGFSVTVHVTNIKWNGTTKVLNNTRDYGNGPTKLKGNDNIYYWRGDLIATIGGTKYYEVGQGTTSSTAAPTGTTTEYTRNFTRDRTQSFTNGATYSSEFTAPFTGTYSRDFNYARDFIRGYTRTRTGTGYYASTRISTLPETDINGDPIEYEVPHDGYARVRSSSYSRTFYYEGNYSRGFAGNYTGNYTRSIDYTFNYSRNFTRTLYYSRNFILIRTSTFEGNYSRTSVGNFAGNYNRTRITDYSRSRDSAYTRSYSTGFVGEYARGYVGDYVGNFAANFVGNYSRNYFGNYTANFEGNYSRNFGGNYSREFTRTRVTQGAGYFTRDFLVGNYTGNYARGYVGEYVGNFAGNYTGDFLTPFTGNYTGEFSRSIGSNYVGNYSRDFAGNYTGNYSRDYTRSFVGNYSRNFIGDYTGAYEGTYSRTSTRARSSSYTNTFGGAYERTFVGNYTGNFIGKYTRNGTGSQEDSEIGWQGETFVAELRTGNTSSLMSEPRGSSNVRVLDSKSFTLYDNDIGTILSTTQNIVHHSATTHTVEFDFNTQGDQAVQGRIYNSGLTLLQSFTIQNANGAQTVTVSDVPAEGQTKQYTIGFYNGSQWLNSGEYTVTKVSSNATDSTPSPAPAPEPSPAPEPEPSPEPDPNENIGLE
jgi:hypothetical protein